MSFALADGFFTTESPGKPLVISSLTHSFLVISSQFYRDPQPPITPASGLEVSSGISALPVCPPREQLWFCTLVPWESLQAQGHLLCPARHLTWCLLDGVWSRPNQDQARGAKSKEGG